MLNPKEIFLKFEEKIYSLAALPSKYVLVYHDLFISWLAKWITLEALSSNSNVYM